MWQYTKNIYHLFVAVLANTYFRFPGRKLKIIGITGTDGKTTTTSLVYHILKTAGKNVSLISTVAAYIGETTYDTGFHVTNPGSYPLQKFLKKIASLGTGKKENYLVLEVTSHGIDQNRIWGIPFAIAGITNITHEHLDYHKTFDNYVVTKAKLLQKAKIAIVNRDDASYIKVIGKINKKNKKIITYGIKNKADITPKTIDFFCPILGEYNVYNCLLAVAICKELAIGDKDIQKGIESFSPPLGRTEIVYKKDFTVMVDFAHTPNALEQLLSSLRPSVKGRLIHVFGSAGLRDRTKRPLMGKAAGRYDDIIILTAEDPRTEKIEDINRQIRSGIKSLKQRAKQGNKTDHNFLPASSAGGLKGEEDQGQVTIMEINNRQDAINFAISLAKKDDFIVITGKGHEPSLNYGHGEEPWSEFEAVKKALRLSTGS